MPLRTQPHPRIVTHDPDGRPNGYLFRSTTSTTPSLPAGQPQQVYLTVVAPKCEGPTPAPGPDRALHCIKGNVKIVVKTEGGYEEYLSGEDHDYTSVRDSDGSAALLVISLGSTRSSSTWPCRA